MKENKKKTNSKHISCVSRHVYVDVERHVIGVVREIYIQT